MKLYGRLLLWFVLANVITASVALALGAWFARQTYSEAEAERDARAAVAVYEQQGATGLMEWLREQRRSNGIIGLLTDLRGRPLHLPPPRFHFSVEPPRDFQLHLRAPGRIFGGVVMEGVAGGADFFFAGPFMASGGENFHSRVVALTSERGATYRWVGSRPPPQGTAALVLDALLRGGVGLLVIAAVALLAARRITGPIAQLERASQDLAGGRLDTRVDESVLERNDELGALGAAFNDMAQRLGRTVDAQRQLLRDVSHELRTPLARLRIAAELAREGGEARHFDRIEQEAEKLGELIQQLLQLARLDLPAAEALPPQPVALDELLADLCAGAALEAAQRGVSMEPRLSPCTVTGREDALRAAFENVLRNAVRYTAAGSTVEVSLALRDGAAHVAIGDRGPGVPPDMLERIFRPFVRVSSARESDSGGVGLGLAIAAGAVRAHGGTIAASNRDGGGLRVTVTLPVAAATTRS